MEKLALKETKAIDRQRYRDKYAGRKILYLMGGR